MKGQNCFTVQRLQNFPIYTVFNSNGTFDMTFAIWNYRLLKTIIFENPSGKWHWSKQRKIILQQIQKEEYNHRLVKWNLIIETLEKEEDEN